MDGSKLFWILFPALLALLAAQSLRASELLGASRRVRLIEEVSQGVAGAGELAAPLLRRNLAVLKEAADLDPANVEIPLARGSLYLLLGRSELAIEAYREAATLEPRAEVYMDLGHALLQDGNFAEARRHFALAVRLDPRLASEVPAAAR